jgi:hypothetical protein
VNKTNIPKLTIKYSVLALNPVFRKKLAVYRSQIMVYRSQKWLISGFRFLWIFSIFFEFKTNFEKKTRWFTETTTSGFSKPTCLPSVFTGFVNHGWNSLVLLVQPSIRAAATASRKMCRCLPPPIGATERTPSCSASPVPSLAPSTPPPPQSPVKLMRMMRPAASEAPAHVRPAPLAKAGAPSASVYFLHCRLCRVDPPDRTS